MAAKLLGVDPAQSVVIALSGVQARSNGNFGLVIGIARKGMRRSFSTMARMWWCAIWADWSTGMITRAPRLVRCHSLMAKSFFRCSHVRLDNRQNTPHAAQFRTT
jgi:hypothetical protein